VSATIPAHYLTISLLCAYQKFFNTSLTEFEDGQRLVCDMWNALHVCTSKKAATIYLKSTANWEHPSHQLLSFMSTIWMYKIHVEKHEIRESLHIAVNKF
jgi:hypothetical protein